MSKQNDGNQDPLQTPSGQTTISKAKKLKEKLNGLIQKLWIDVRKVNQEEPKNDPKLINKIRVIDRAFHLSQYN